MSPQADFSNTAFPVEHVERLVVLEQEVKALKEDLGTILSEVKMINAQMVKYRGFLGGITFVLSGIPLVWMFGKDWFLAHWK